METEYCEEVMELSEEKKKLIDETVENLKHLDEKSLLIMKSGAELLKSRDALDKEPEEHENQKAG